jgi:hypothetical protein
LEGSATAQRKAMNSIKYIMNEVRRPVVVAGTAEVLTAVSSDPQISSRLRPLPLPRFDDDEVFQEMLAGFEMLIPLRKASELDSAAMSQLIYEHTDGIVGHVSDLLNKSAILAIKDGVEQITEDLIVATRGDAGLNLKQIRDSL